MQKWICIKIFLGILLLSVSNVSIAEIQCSLAGEWYQSTNVAIVELEQNGSKVSTLHPLVIPECGEHVLEGDNENNHFLLKWHYPNANRKSKNPGCQYWTELNGKFAENNCLRITGEMTYYMVEDNKTIKYTQPFSWWRNQMLIVSPDPSPAFN